MHYLVRMYCNSSNYRKKSSFPLITTCQKEAKFKPKVHCVVVSKCYHAMWCVALLNKKKSKNANKARKKLQYRLIYN